MIVGDCTSNFLEISALDSHNMGGTPTLFTRYCAGVIVIVKIIIIVLFYLHFYMCSYEKLIDLQHLFLGHTSSV